jgi:hypothetical protein
MPKARKRRKETGRRNATNPPASSNKNVQSAAPKSAAPARPLFVGRARGPESLIMPVMVALGCWGFAFSFIFLSTEANHVLFGAMAALLALMWSVSVGIRIRKLLSLRQKT